MPKAPLWGNPLGIYTRAGSSKGVPMGKSPSVPKPGIDYNQVFYYYQDNTGFRANARTHSGVASPALGTKKALLKFNQAFYLNGNKYY